MRIKIWPWSKISELQSRLDTQVFICEELKRDALAQSKIIDIYHSIDKSDDIIEGENNGEL